MEQEQENEVSDVYEESSSDYETDSSEYDSDSEFELDESYNIAIDKVDQAPDLSDVDTIPWSKLTENEDGHFDVDFDNSTSDTKRINDCKKPIDFFYLLFSPFLWNLIVTNTNKYTNDNNLNHWKVVNGKMMKGFLAILFNMGLIKKKMK